MKSKKSNKNDQQDNLFPTGINLISRNKPLKSIEVKKSDEKMSKQSRNSSHFSLIRDKTPIRLVSEEDKRHLKELYSKKARLLDKLRKMNQK